jgi:hypothetical protein
MAESVSDRDLKRYTQQRWWEQHKDKVLAYSIMVKLIAFFVIYQTIAIVNDWDIHFN